MWLTLDSMLFTIEFGLKGFILLKLMSSSFR
jgi:hypothetical protein